MDSGMRTTVVPEPLASPIQFSGFRAQMLAPQRIGDPQSARAFARPYRDVAQRLQRWEEQGHVLTLPRTGVHLHEYTVGGLTARGLVGLVDLTRPASPGELPGVFPHEDVHPEQVRELADRMEEMSMNPAPILLVHEGPAELRALIRSLVVSDPDHSFTDRAGNQHRVWTIDAPDELARVQHLLAPSHLMIADGHHRYAAYLALARRHPASGFTRGLAIVVDQLDTPLFLGAIHRVLPQHRLEDVLAWATRHGAVVEPVPDQESALQRLDTTTLVVGDGESWAAIPLPSAAANSPVEWLGEIFASADVRTIEYHHSVESALTSGDGVIMLLPTPSLARIAAVAGAGGVLPEKATSFQPKPPLGVMMRTV